MHPSLTIGLSNPFPGALGLGLGLAAAGCAALTSFARRFAPQLWLATYLLAALGLGAFGLGVAGVAHAAVPSFAALLVGGIACTWLLALSRLQSLGMPLERVLLLLLGGVASALVGGRALHLLVSGGALATAMGSRFGLSVFGAIVGASLFVLVLSRRSAGPRFGALLDAGTPAVCVGLGVTRLGCLLGGCCYGRPVGGLPGWLALPLAAFAPGTPVRVAFATQPLELGIAAVQPLESALWLLLGAVCEVAWRRRARWRLPSGSVFALACAGYGVARFGLQFLRGDLATGPAGLGAGQLLAVGLVVVPLGCVLGARRRRPQAGGRGPRQEATGPSGAER